MLTSLPQVHQEHERHAAVNLPDQVGFAKNFICNFFANLCVLKRLFFNFLDSLLDEQNFKMNLLILEVYGMLIDRLKSKIKPNLRSVVCALLKHASDHKVVVRIENYRVLEKLMLAVKPNQVITQLLDHLGDKKALVRESILNMIMFGLLTFPSNEFDLKNIAATVVPTLVDPKRRVRHAALESVSILAAFLGPTKVSHTFIFDL